MNQSVLNIENYRILSQIFTPNIVRNIVKENSIGLYNRKIKKHLKTNKNLTTNSQILSELYSLLEKIIDVNTFIKKSNFSKPNLKVFTGKFFYI